MAHDLCHATCHDQPLCSRCLVVVSTYFLSKTFVELPRSFLAILLFSSILYPVVSLRWGAEYFFKFILAVFLSALAAESISYLGKLNA